MYIKDCVEKRRKRNRRNEGQRLEATERGGKRKKKERE